MNSHLGSRVALHVDDVDILGQLDTGVGGDGRSLDGDPVGIVDKGVGQSGFPPSGSLGG
jgi:hypothetical protein